MWSRYDLANEDKGRSVVGAKCAKHITISINPLELLGMVMTAYVVVAQESDHSDTVGALVLIMLDENVSAAS